MGKKNEPAEKPTMVKFRNYVPKTPDLQKMCIPKEGTAPIEQSIHKDIKELVDMIGQEDQTLDLAPKRPNWDLKRDVSEKTDKLSKKTDRAIIELIRKKIADEKKEGTEGMVEVTDEAGLALAEQVAQREAEKSDED